MSKWHAMCAAALVGGAGVSGWAGIITFDELPVGSTLDGETIDGVRFTYLPNGSTLSAPRIVNIPGTIPGLRDDITLRGESTDPNYAIRLDFNGPLDDFGLSLTTTPFSFLSTINASIRFIDSAGEVVLERPDFVSTTIDGPVLPNGDPIFKVGRTDTSLFRNGYFDVHTVEIRLTGGNPGGWFMDNIRFTTIPSPPAAAGLAAALLAGRRRR